MCLFSFLFLNYLLFSFFVAVLGLRCCASFSLVAASRGYSSLRGEGFTLQWLLFLWSTGSRAQALVVAARGLSCCEAYGIFPDQGGMEAVSPALQGGFLTTGPPGKSLLLPLKGSHHVCV